MKASLQISVLKSAGARAGTLPVAAVFSLLTSALILRDFGSDSFSQYTLVISIAAVLPFADLGVGAATVNAISRSGSLDDDAQAMSVVVSSLRVLLSSGAALITAAIVLSLTGGWQALLGNSFQQDAALFALTGVILFAVSMPLGLGQRIAVGRGKNERQVLIQGLQPILVFASVSLATILVDDGRIAIVCFFASYLLTTMFVAIDANRMTNGFFWRAAKLVPSIRKVRGANILQTAGPMLVVMIGMPLVLQTHRMVLSHLSTPESISKYSLAAQMFLPVAAIVGAASVSLWPSFARARDSVGESQGPHPIKIAIFFAIGSLGVCSVAVLIAPKLANVISSGTIEINTELGLSFTFFIVCQSMQSPLGIYLTDVSGLRFQSICVLAVVASTFILSSVTVPILGAGGPLIATGTSILVFQVIPYSIRILFSRQQKKVKNDNGQEFH